MKVSAKKIPALLFFCVPIFIMPAFAAAAQNPLAQQHAKAHPSIRLQDPDYNFGTVVQGATVEHAFALKNTGGQTLKILHVKPS